MTEPRIDSGMEIAMMMVLRGGVYIYHVAAVQNYHSLDAFFQIGNGYVGNRGSLAEGSRARSGSSGQPAIPHTRLTDTSSASA